MLLKLCDLERSYNGFMILMYAATVCCHFCFVIIYMYLSYELKHLSDIKANNSPLNVI